jgi:replicative DNA helicase
MTLPQNHSAEKAAISILAKVEDAITAYPWTPDMFLDSACRAIFHHIVEIRKLGKHSNIATIAAIMEGSGELKTIGGRDALGDIIATYPLPYGADSSHAEIFHRQLIDATSRRNVLLKSNALADDLRSGEVSAEEFVAELSSAAVVHESRKRQSLTEQINELLDEIENNKPPECFKFGIQKLDYALYGGFQRGELVTVAGPTSGGKSLMLAQATLAAIKAGKSVIFYSLEMPAKAVLRRLISNLANVSLPKPHERISAYQWESVSKSFTEIQKMPLTICDNISGISDIEADAVRLAKLGKADLIVVDYIQRVRNSIKGANREQVISDISSRLKTLAMQTGSALLTASQLNKQGDVRESAAIEQDSDILIKIQESGMLCSKFRRGASNFEVLTTMRGDLGRFEENNQ